MGRRRLKKKDGGTEVCKYDGEASVFVIQTFSIIFTLSITNSIIPFLYIQWVFDVCMLENKWAHIQTKFSDKMNPCTLYTLNVVEPSNINLGMCNTAHQAF